MTSTRRTRSRAASVAAAAVLLTGLSACSLGSDTEATDAAAADLDQAAGETRLDDVCGTELTVQLQWQPQSDMGALFALLGPDHRFDPATKSVTATLVSEGEDTGTELTLRAGGPAIGFQSVPSQMYVDDTIDLGLVHTDMMIAASGDQPVVGVTPLLTHTPAMLMWDPATYGDDFDITQIADTGATVVVSGEQAYPAWLVAQGYATQKQIDPSYDGNPARFVGDTSIVQQGFANSEPYTYENEISAWGKPVGYQLLKDAGYDPYASNLSVRADELDEMAPCLERLVPMVQRAGAAYISDPGATNDVIVEMIASDDSYFPYSDGEAAYSAQLLADEGLIAEEGGVVGGYDQARLTAFVDEVAPMIREQGNKVPDTLSADDLFTDRFVDDTVGMP
ncbi:hypothetical protein [Nocardioides sp. YIM 152588]|uniref:hypothetical protein n=1 Tax=Nocardioides sp. YIM 152588 TaxID=3158259 RepID=UPI0032E4D6C8